MTIVRLHISLRYKNKHISTLDEPTSVVWSSGESNTFEHDLEEHLGVKCEGGRVEGDLLDRWIKVVRPSNGVGRQQFDDFGRGEFSCIFHAGEDLIERVLGFRDQSIWSRGSCVRATEFEVQLRSAGTVGNANRCGKLDQISGSDLVP